jgi:hypothetical protein
MPFFARFEPFRGKSIEMPFLEQLTLKIKSRPSKPIKPNQA